MKLAFDSVVSEYEVYMLFSEYGWKIDNDTIFVQWDIEIEKLEKRPLPVKKNAHVELYLNVLQKVKDVKTTEIHVHVRETVLILITVVVLVQNVHRSHQTILVLQ